MKKILILSAAFLALSVADCYAVVGAALKFDGTNDYVQCGSILGSSYTKEAWIRITNLALSNNLISGGNADGQHAFHAATGSGNRLSAGHNGNYTMVQDPTPLLVNTWYHVAVTYDLATTTMRLYKNGVLVSTNTAVPAYNAGNMVRLGCSAAAAGVFGGMMDEVRLWNYARTGADIATYMNCELTGTELGLNQYYRFNQGTASANNAGLTTLTDLAGTAQNGTLVNFALTGTASNWVAPGGVTSGNSCCATANVTLGSQTNILCNGDLTGSATVNASGGISFTYAWAPSGGNAATASGLAAGTYTCTVMNECTSTATIAITITQPPVLNVTAGNTSPMCIGASADLNGSSTGGSGTVIYVWTPGAFSGPTVTVNPSSTTSYTVTGTDGNGCTSTASTTVTVNQLPTVTATSNPVNGVVCSGSPVTLTGGGASSYIWSGGVTNAVPFIPPMTNTYTVTGTDANGCQNTATKNITVNVCGGPTLTAASCGATNLVLSQWLYHNAVAGATNYQYLLTNTISGQTHTRVKGNSQPNMPLAWIPGIVYGQTYSVQVRAYVNNAWGAFGPMCNITLQANAPGTQLTSASCNSTGLSHTSTINCVAVTGGSNYRFTLSNATYNQTKARTVSNIQLSQFSGLTPNTTYTVTVTEYSGGMWSAPVTSPTCTITMGAVVRMGNPDQAETDEAVSFETSFYPNPLGSGISPSVSISGADGQEAIIRILDISGRELTAYQTTVAGDEYAMTLSNFPELAAGIYMMQVTVGEKQENIKFIVQ